MSTQTHIEILPSDLLNIQAKLQLPSQTSINSSLTIEIFEHGETGNFTLSINTNFIPHHWNDQYSLNTSMAHIKNNYPLNVKYISLQFKTYNLIKSDIHMLSEMFHDPSLKKIHLFTQYLNIEFINCETLLTWYTEHIPHQLNDMCQITFEYSSSAWNQIASGYIGYGG